MPAAGLPDGDGEQASASLSAHLAGREDAPRSRIDYGRSRLYTNMQANRKLRSVAEGARRRK